MATFFKSYLGEVTITDTDSTTIGSGSYHLYKEIDVTVPTGQIWVVKKFQAVSNYWAGYKADVFFVHKRMGITLLQCDRINSNGAQYPEYYTIDDPAKVGLTGTGWVAPKQELFMFFPGDKISVYLSGYDGAVGFNYTMTATFRAYAM